MNPSSNQTFSFPRFARLFSRHTTEHLPGYGMSVGVLAGFLLLLLGLAAYSGNGVLSMKGQAEFFVFFLLISAIIFTSTIFSQFGEKRQATVALLLPASHLEKYLVGWLYSMPIFLLVFTSVFYAVDALVLYGGAPAGHTPELLNVFGNADAVKAMAGLLVLLHAVWLCGAIYFEKTHFIKTGFALFTLLLGLSLVNYQALKVLVGGELRPAPPFTTLTLMEGGTHVYNLGLPMSSMQWLSYLPLGLTLLLWVAAYFRLTEKQL
ncbi:hypothetical protein [Hymenobacter ruricola]|uniref:ABC transporter permease n=1 Tax=Hymenobacter ruricola TaxID=2791023 RepID=A0ABS0HZ09_9BACT|nr:hypothetical protein [Hymenobacter ruricola]MBF9219940.1 hypothetical protein [Hymenobacter ruricola]